MKFLLFMVAIIIAFASAQDTQFFPSSAVVEEENEAGSGRLMGLAGMADKLQQGLSQAREYANGAATLFDSFAELAQQRDQRHLTMGESNVNSDGSNVYSAMEGREVGEGEQQQHNMVPKRGGLLNSMLEMMGMSESQVGRMAVNVIVYLGEIFAKRIMGDEETINNEIPTYRSIMKEEGVMSWLSTIVSKSQTRGEEVKARMASKALPEEIIQALREKTGDATSCVQLAVCKMAPVIWGVQSGVSSREMDISMSLTANTREWAANAYSHLPDLTKLVEFGAGCDAKFPTCPMMDVAPFVAAFAGNHV